jgi:hypothetical protein
VNGWRTAALLVGAALVAGHAAAFPLLLDRFDRAPLRVSLRAPLVARGPGIELDAELPADAAERTRVLVDGEDRGPAALRGALHLVRPPGLHRIEWRARYGGGVERRVGWTQLVGPFQDPARPPCSARLSIGQRFLDDGRAGPGTLAHVLAGLVAREMRGFEAFPVGAFERVRAIAMRWSGPAGGVGGHLRVALELGFRRAALELTIRIAPRLVDRRLRLDSRTEARVRLHSRIAQWVSDLIDGDELAARVARGEVTAMLDGIMTAPPPLPLGHGRELQLAYCADRDIDVVAGSHAAVPLAVELGPAAASARRAGRVGAPILLPGALGPASAMRGPLAIELDENALGGLLYVLWASGALEQALGESGILDRFHSDPVVAELLSVRAHGPALPLPPTLTRSRRPGQSYDISVASTVLLEDGGLHTPAHIFGRAGFELTREARAAPRVSLHDLGLTCEPEPGLLEPCYPELAGTLIERAPELHGQLSSWFGDLVTDLLIDREIAPAGAAARFRLRRSVIHSPPVGRPGPLRIDLIGRVEPAP